MPEAAGIPPRPSPSGQATDAQAKAAWILNFARFVEWPSNAFTSSQSPILVGVLGKDPITQDLQATLERQLIHGRRFLVRPVATDPELRACQILFVSSTERRRLRELPDRIRGACVLTVGDTDDFLDHGGVINFVLREKSVRFEINITTAQAAGIKLDANLLRVALAVRGRYD